MTTTEYRPGRHAARISSDSPAPYGDVDPTAATAAFAAVPRTAAPAVSPTAVSPTAAPPVAVPPAAVPSVAVPQQAASHPMPYGPPHTAAPQYAYRAAGPQTAVPAQRGPIDHPVPPLGHLPSQPVRRTSPTKRRRWPYVVGGILLLLVVIGLAVGATGSDTVTPAPTVATPAPVPSAVVPTAPVQVPTVAPIAPAAPIEPTGPATTVGDGSYEVGVDMAAGKYKTTGPGADSITGMCYQERASNDSGELGSIISNDIVQGPGVVTVKSGEVVTLSGGCQWTKQ